MSTIVAKLPDLYESYKRWVSENPQVVGDFETTAKWLSYFLVGRVNSSTIVSELIFALSNLLVLFNDRIIEKSKVGYPMNDRSKYKLKVLLTTLEYSEVFIELSAKKLWGNRGRWICITIVQILKCVGRLTLKFYHREVITQNPPIVALDRKNIERSIAESTASEEQMPEMYDPSSSSFTFTLKRSGRVVRKIEGSPPVYLRSWKAIDPDHAVESSSTEIPRSVPTVHYKKLTTPELLYILKPVIHLGSAGIFGINSWKSYGVALFIDLLSLKMYQKHLKSLTKKQRLELSRRTVALLLYLMRSPFYEKFTQKKLNALIRAISYTIPFSGTICQPLLEYIPQWQQTYFYMWST